MLGSIDKVQQFRAFDDRDRRTKILPDFRREVKNIGHPLACDDLYGDGKPVLLSSIKKKFKLSQHDEEERPMIARLALHSYKLVFDDMNGTRMELIAEMPKEFRALMQQLKKNA